MSPDHILGLACFLCGLAAGVLVLFVLFEVERRAEQRRRLQRPPFTTEGQGRG